MQVYTYLVFHIFRTDIRPSLLLLKVATFKQQLVASFISYDSGIEKILDAGDGELAFEKAGVHTFGLAKFAKVT